MRFLEATKRVGSTLWGGILDLIFPAVCQGCGAEGTYLCVACQARIRAPLERCWVCRKNSFMGQVHDSCAGRDTALRGILVAAEYEQPSIRNLIWYLKYNSVRDIAYPLSLLLTDFFISRELQDYFAGGAVIPVPLHPKRLRLRGFNQAELLAERLAANLGLQYLPILQRRKNTPRQIELPREERFGNVAGSFSAIPTPSLGERKILLIDDVATTGATLNECAKVLRAQQPSEIWGLVVARN